MNEGPFKVSLSLEEVLASIGSLPPDEQLEFYRLFVDQMEQNEEGEWELLPDSGEAATAIDAWLFRRQLPG